MAAWLYSLYIFKRFRILSGDQGLVVLDPFGQPFVIRFGFQLRTQGRADHALIQFMTGGTFRFKYRLTFGSVSLGISRKSHK